MGTRVLARISNCLSKTAIWTFLPNRFSYSAPKKSLFQLDLIGFCIKKGYLHFCHVLEYGLLGIYLIITPKKSKFKKKFIEIFCLSEKEVFKKLTLQKTGWPVPAEVPDGHTPQYFAVEVLIVSVPNSKNLEYVQTPLCYLAVEVLIVSVSDTKNQLSMCTLHTIDFSAVDALIISVPNSENLEYTHTPHYHALDTLIISVLKIFSMLTASHTPLFCCRSFDCFCM